MEEDNGRGGAVIWVAETLVGKRASGCVVGWQPNDTHLQKSTSPHLPSTLSACTLWPLFNSSLPFPPLLPIGTKEKRV